MESKLYVKYLFGAIVLFISFHLFMWVFFTSKIFGLNDQMSIGDLARMSYQIDMIVKKKLQFTLPKSFIYDKTYTKQNIDLITVGDSFSHGGGGGTNSYYQDYLSSIYNLNVLNVEPINAYDYIQTAALLYNKNFLKERKTKYLLLQSIERFAISRFAQDMNLTAEDDDIKISPKTLKIKHLPVKIISTANYKIPFYYFAYKFKENAQKNIYKLALTKHLFSLNKKKVLIFHDDIKNIPQFTKDNVIKLNRNLNRLASLLQKQNVKLIFMPTPDKYDLYYRYLKDNKHPKNPFFDLLRPLKKDYIFIDTKKILEPYLEKGTLDIYHVDDTHWTYKASEAIANSKVFKDLFGTQ